MGLTAEQTEKILLEARSLERAGRHREATQLLTSRLRNFTSHGEDALPCLCKRCLVPDRVITERGGVHFMREYAVNNGRVLFFWIPAELEGRRGEVRHAVQVALSGKLKGRGATA